MSVKNTGQALLTVMLAVLLAGCPFDNDNDGGEAGTTPGAFSFVDVTDVAVSTLITSAAVSITDLTEPAPISITGGSYSIGCGATFTSGASTISNGQTVCVRHTSSPTTTTITDTTLTVGGVADTFRSTTASFPDPAVTSGLKTISSAGENRTYYLDLPDDYFQTNEAKPLIIAYHGTSLSHEYWLNGFYPLRDSVGDGAILIYPDALFSESAGYTQWEEAKDSAMFEDLLASLPASLRFDPNRIFITGHSSGAGFANVIGCHYGNRIRAIAPVVGTSTDVTCTGAFAVMDIVGSKDPLFNISQVAHEFWVLYNGFEADTTTPGTVPPCVDHAAGSVDYPVLWCAHDEGDGPTPENPVSTAHDWPGFAGDAIWTFFSSLSLLEPRSEAPPGGGNENALGSADTTMSFTLNYPLTMPQPQAGTIVLFPPGTVLPAAGQQPSAFLNLGLTIGAVGPGSQQSYQVPVKFIPFSGPLVFPGSYTAAVFIYVEGGSFPQPAPGVDHAVLFPVELTSQTTPIVVPGVLTLVPFETAP